MKEPSEIAATTARGIPSAAADGMPAVDGFVEVEIDGAPILIEHRWLARERRDRPLLVFLHEGLGSIPMWRDFPARLVAATGASGLLFTRPGYGASTAEPGDRAWDNGYLHRQARVVVPAVLAALARASADPRLARPWLVGHSDGGSIALIMAAERPASLAGAILIAPHIVVEDRSVDGIAQARDAYRAGGLRESLARHHADPDLTFWRWNDVWLSAPFRHWSIAETIDTIRCPLLALQGSDDAYGTMAQIHGIVQRVPHAQWQELPGCGHSPHRDRPDAVVAACREFLSRHVNLQETPHVQKPLGRP